MSSIEISESEETDEHAIQFLRRETRVQNHGMHLGPSIYMTPSVFRDLSPDCYYPRVVSIGPLHHLNENLQMMEGQKASYLHELMRRFESPPQETMTACVQKVKSSIEKIRACYPELANSYFTDNYITQLMIMDGCFILEYLCKMDRLSILFSKYMLSSKYIPYDLILLENQIPFFVLNDIFECIILKSKPTASLTHLILSLLHYVDPIAPSSNFNEVSAYPDHILDLLHKCYHNSFARSSISREFFRTPYSAVELDKSGVHFKPDLKTPQRLAMRFKRPSMSKRTLCMPVLTINESTNTVLYNLSS